MAAFDLPLDQLRTYTPEREDPPDFDAFWADTLATSRAAATPPSFERVDGPLRNVVVEDVTFSGFEGQRIKAWLLAPASATRPLPAVVEYVGYGGGRSLPWEWLTWSAAGYVHLVMDTRGQGSSWSTGDTPDPDASAVGGQYPGFVTRGIGSPATLTPS